MSSALIETHDSERSLVDFNSLRRRLRVYQLMTRNVLCLKYSDHLNLLDSSPDWRKYRHLPVIDDEGHLKGMICHRDLMNEFASSLSHSDQERRFCNCQEIAVRDAMIWNVLTAGEFESLEETAKKMFENRCGAIPIVDRDNKVVGLVTEADFTKLFYLGEECLTQQSPAPRLSLAL